MDKRKDSIYIYIWEELNTIYIGRTIDPKRRHRQHKNRERERTYQFSSKHGVQHPPMIILEENLSVEEGVEREKYWIKYYKKNKQCVVLNKSNGGELGSLGESNEEKRKEYLRQYYLNNKKKYNESNKKYREKNKEEIKIKDRIRNKQYYQNNKEKCNQRKKEYYLKNKKRINEYQKQYREKHKLS